MNYRKLKDILGVPVQPKHIASAIFGNRYPEDERQFYKIYEEGFRILETNAQTLLRNSVPDADFTFLDAVRKRLLSDKELARVARQLELEKLINKELAKQEGGIPNDYLADIVISLTGFVNLAGEAKALDFSSKVLQTGIAHILRRYTTAAKISIEPSVPIQERLTELLEEKGRQPPRYLIRETKENSQIKMGLVVDVGTGLVLGKGCSTREQDAYEKAARRAVAWIRKHPCFEELLCVLEAD